MRPEQRALFPVPVVFWLAEAYVEPSFRPLAVYAGERLVGFLVHGVDPEDEEHWLVALMIDHTSQGQGYGRAAVEALVGELLAGGEVARLWVGHRPENEGAARLYEGLGFAVVEAGAGTEVRRCFKLARGSEPLGRV